MDGVQVAVDLTRAAFVVAVKVSLPLLLAGLVVGVIVSVLQAATSIQEQTLSFIPKILAVVITAYVLMQWMMVIVLEYTRQIFEQMPWYFK
jgi:flagellar biosynthetic protein FliQ